MKKSSILFILVLSCLFPVFAMAQTVGSVASAPDSTSSAPKVTYIHIERADSLIGNQQYVADAKILYGDVVLRHDSAYMYCDSAYLYQERNTFEAFSNVRMEQGDTLFIYANYLLYDGNTQMAYLREQVRMENNQVTLFTDSLNYDRTADIGYYFDEGLIMDEENDLSSIYGQYSTVTKLAVFNDSVRLENLKFTLYSDTLHYSTDTKIATILGPSVIVTDSGTVHTSRGWYDTEKQTSLLLDRSEVTMGEKILIGDSIHYDRETGFGEVFGNMILRDTAQQIILTGQYGFYNELTEYAFATDEACFIEYGQGDSLYLHADTLKMVTIDDDFREINAYYGVRFYRSDMQGVCDSMLFNTRDSVLYMFDDPILWNEQYQIYGDSILVYFNDSTIDYAHIKQFAFAAQEVDTTYYNQLKGNDMKAFFEGKQVRLIDVEGNAESIFYPIEEDGGGMIGLNETKSGFLSIWIKDNQLEQLKIWPSPQGSTTPIPDLNPDQKFLKDFHWFDYIRPKDPDDIYREVKREAGTTPKRSNKFVH
ncbi:lipopolysaccharide export system protein LptA [Parabacteroides sp. PFB2-12]|uniref:OstA-like protein n=1 Tax=unclassified Parabacteroides TaxID=2649774 RepID=UPI00247F0487|nr:lipopolysaccharide export system protein LptA [Parabacteroides sp. PM6-13]MDH6390218.1 lipopolysaccharide export system protein LptA [Parabacteroides sp. PFB2-12]